MQERIRNVIKEKYSVDIPPECVLNESNTTTNKYNYYTIVLPKWLYATKNGNADKRYSYNPVVYIESQINLDSYIIKSKSIETILDLVHTLRQNGAIISPHYLETEKALKHGKAIKKQGNVSIHRIISQFEEHPTEFEHFCADLFRSEGYEATVTSATNDGGFDIFLKDKDTGETALVECKCYDFYNRIGRPMLQKLYGANAALSASQLIFITTSDFSKQAVDYGHEVNIELINGKKLLEWINQSNRNIDEVDDESETIHNMELTSEDIIALLPDDLKDKYQ